ncbi:PREDICTED: carbonic anhydrase 2-like [Ceratosolen solmsi marchali]|uniref:Carbonic anhydrase n=1 Tax=Ceratosolen solmsi marchali TaxID=326594 RepID=A0AAJ6YP67_9HYME|nr:PREDICTED: carbonic anhydrase 2-like [Ceratosolen solmsi marchali]
MATENQLKTLTRKKQSPIDLLDIIVRPIYLPPLQLNGHWLNDGKAFLTNNGTTAVINLSGERIPSIIQSGPLNDEYELCEVHFHWGKDNCNGSEHTINGTWYSMEAHAVHWNRKYQIFDECLKYEDGLCILVFLFLVKDTDDCISCVKLEKITNNLKYIINKDSKVEIDANCLCWIRKANHCKYYYFYNGSFNQLDYPECALWIIFPNYIQIGSDQIMEFRKLKDEKGRTIKSNVRKIQHLGDRKIYKAICPCKKGT